MGLGFTRRGIRYIEYSSMDIAFLDSENLHSEAGGKGGARLRIGRRPGLVLGISSGPRPEERAAVARGVEDDAVARGGHRLHAGQQLQRRRAVGGHDEAELL